MATLAVAVKANAALLLPSLLLATYANRIANANIQLEFQDVDTLKSKSLLELRRSSDTVPNTLDVIKILRSYVKSHVDDLVNEWLDRISANGPADLMSMDHKTINVSLEQIDSHLTLRSYVVSYQLNVADIAVWGALRGNKIAQSALKRTGLDNLKRWYNFMEATNPWFLDVVTELNATAARKKAAASAAGASYDIGLGDGTTPLVTRFPPEPSGYLHIGHVKAAMLNDYFAHDKANGTLICRYDDTNPSKEKQEFEDTILEDLAMIGIRPDRSSHSSDYFQKMYDLCLQMIQEGKAYADGTDRLTMQEERKGGIKSRYRDSGTDDSLARFQEMASGSDEGSRWCIRAKISVDDPNKALRDPVIYRCNLEPHHRTGTTWKVYPTYDFCAPILDSLEGVTHALRTNEYRDRNPQYYWMQQALGLRQVTIWDFSRLNFIRTVLSKRKLTKIVDQKAVWGWDDPRMPTIRGIKRRGMTTAALREFILKQGPSQNITNMDWNLIWAINKKHIDPISPRHTLVDKNDVVLATVSGVAAETTTEEKPKHGKNKELGMKTVVYSNRILIDQTDARSFAEGEEITLMNWGNAIVVRVDKDGDIVKGLALQLHLSGDVKTTDKKITWLSQAQKLVPVEVVDFDYLITKDKLEKMDSLEDFLNPKTEFRSFGFADCNVAGLSEGDIIQFERKGYYRVDRPFVDGTPAVLFCIPSRKGASSEVKQTP